MGTVVGPGLAKDLHDIAGQNAVSIQGVDYPASAAGNAQLGASGGPEMVKLAQSAIQQCPKTKLVLGGYSQGAMVVHYAMKNGIDASNVGAIAVFGDPLNGQSFGDVPDSKVSNNCGSSDFICATGPSNGSGSHLSYGSDLESAAEFIVKATGEGSS